MPTNRSIIPPLHPAPHKVKQPGYVGAPTPWIGANAVDQKDMQYRFRLFLKRRRGAVHVEVHSSSPLGAGRTVVVRPAKPGYYDFQRAAQNLIRMAKWDETCKPGQRAIWDEAAPGFEHRLEYASTVASFMPRLLEPKPGRPIAEDTKLTARSGFAVARVNRRNEILMGCQRMTNVLVPLMTITMDPRKMQGYTRMEQQRINVHLRQIERVNQILRDEVFAESLHTTSESLKRYHEGKAGDAAGPVMEASDTTVLLTEDELMTQRIAQAQKEFDELMHDQEKRTL